MYKGLKVLVIDEADRMLEIGFEARRAKVEKTQSAHG